MTSTNVPVEDESVLVPTADADSIILLNNLFNRTFVKCAGPFQGVEMQKGKQLFLYIFNKKTTDLFTFYP